MQKELTEIESNEFKRLVEKLKPILNKDNIYYEYEVKGEKRELWVEENILAYLLREDVVFMNFRDYHLKTKNFEHNGSTIVIFQNCSDVFMWGCADGEDIETEEQLILLYLLYIDNKQWGNMKWACMRRNMQPQAPIRRDMKKTGYWDDVLENLGKNPDEE